MSSNQQKKNSFPVTMPQVGKAPPPNGTNLNDAREWFSKRKIPENIVIPSRSLPSLASNTIPGPDSIAELARALKNDPDLIYKWVYENIELTPTYGEQKGALGCLIDGIGNSFDQAALLNALFTAAGLTSSLVFGTLQLSNDQLSSWLGTDPTNINYAYSVLYNGGVPVQWILIDNVWWLTVPHLWVQVTIDGTAYVFDPSFKSYTSVLSSIDIATASGYTQSDLLSAAADGATIDPDGVFVQNINRTAIRSKLATYSTNLASYIRENHPTAELSDVVGGRSINPVVTPIRQTSLPYETPGETPTLWAAVPDSYKVTVSLVYGSINLSYFGADLHGQRLTIIPSEDTSNMYLNGVLIGSSTGSELQCTINHPYPYINAYEVLTFPAGDPNTSYLLGTTFGIVGKNLSDHWKNLLCLIRASGAAANSEPAIGTQLGLNIYDYIAQLSRAHEVNGLIANCVPVAHHLVGLASWVTNPSFTAGDGQTFLAISSIFTYFVPLSSASNFSGVSTAAGEFGHAFETVALDQNTGVESVSPSRIIDAANEAGIKILKITSSNYSSTFPTLSGYASVSHYVGEAVQNGGSAFIAQSAPETLEGVPSEAFLFISSSGGLGGYYATLGLPIKGAGGTKYCPPPKGKPKKKDPNDKTIADPVVMRTGDFRYSSKDISVGSSEFPYSLSFEPMYDSRLFTQTEILGRGWKHNWLATATIDSDSFRGMGQYSPIEASAALVAFFVNQDLYTDTTYPVEKVAAAFTTTQWLSDALVNSTVSVDLPDGNYDYYLLSDGSYNPQLADASTLTLNTDGTYTHVTTHQEKRNFDSNGNLTTLIFPYGVTITLTYTVGLLTNVSNGLGRELTFGYSNGFLNSVTDGNGRSVFYTVDPTTLQLTKITDPLNQQTTFTYDSEGRFLSYYLPQSPTDAMVTNSYDTLNRVSSQKDVYGNIRSYYIAGSRSEFSDPDLNSIVVAFDENNNMISHQDELGNITLYQFDALRRLTTRTLPEGNSTSWTYDAKNNALTATYKAKPGSSLANIVETWTYDATYNKKHTYVDGNGKTWTWNYDPATGNLLSAVKPVVNSQTPQEVWTYNARGQVLTYTDETSIVRKFTYDTSTEKLLTLVDDYGTSPHLNLTQQFGYDAVGNRNSVTDPNLNVTTYLFDNNRQLKQKTDPTPFSYVTTYGYDLNGNQTTIQRQTGIPATPYQTYTTVYTMSNKIYTVTDPVSNVTTNTYDTMDRLLTVTDAQSRVTTFAYDARSKLYTVKDATGTISETRTYTNNGHLYQLKDARSETTSYSYDGFDRSDKTTYADASYEENQSYDNNGNLLTYRTRSGNTIVNTYDVLNRLATKTPTGEAVVTTAYDLHGRLLSATTPVVSGNPATGAFSIAYDTAGRVKSETTPDSKVTQYGLDSNGNLTKLTYPDGYYVTRVFDQLNRLTNIKLNGATASAIGITYDQLSRRNVLTYGNGATSTYTFALNEDMTGLAAAFVGSSVTFGYGFNKVHQETSRSVSDGTYMWHPSATATTTYAAANSVNEYPTVGGAAYTYDGNANLKTDGTWTYTYDTENHLLSATKSGTSASYVYDPMHRQIQKTVGTTKSRYVYAGWRRIADYDGTAGTLQNRYVYGDGLDEPLVEVSSSGTLTYFHADRQGSVIATTNSSGAIVSQFKYGPYGESVALAGTTFGFTGQRFDAETGLYYFKFRHYSTALGRFLETDPMSFRPVEGKYLYVKNDPLNLYDTYGLDIWIEGPSDGEPIGHQSIAVGDPYGGYSTYSYGINGGLIITPGGIAPTGSTYQDKSIGGAIEQYKKTTPEQDAAFKKKLEAEQESGIYNIPSNYCRTYSQRKFDQAPGTELPPPPRKPAPWYPLGTITSGSATSTTSGTSSSATSPK